MLYDTVTSTPPARGFRQRNMTAQAAATVQDSTSAAPAAEVPEAVEQAFTRVQNGADIRGVVLEGVF